MIRFYRWDDLHQNIVSGNPLDGFVQDAKKDSRKKILEIDKEDVLGMK